MSENDNVSPELTESLLQMAGVLIEEDTLDAILELVVTLAESTLKDISGASVSMMMSDKTFATTNASSPSVKELDQFQYSSAEGPCIDAIHTGKTVNVRLADEGHRWPEFTKASRAHNVHSVLSLPLVIRERTLGALNLFSPGDTPLGDDVVKPATSFARQASVVLNNAAQYMSAGMVNAHLTEAVESRDIIGQAKGITMARDNCSATEAFDKLRVESQHQNRKLRDVAQDVIDSVKSAP